MAEEAFKDFFDEIELICRKYGLSISHEDGHGSFEIKKFDENNLDWLREASSTEKVIKQMKRPK